MLLDLPTYRVLEKLGAGAGSSVHRARSMRDGRDYAVKMVKVAKPQDMAYVDLLKAELKVGSAVHNVVTRRVYELKLLRRRLRVRGAVLFMEYVDAMPMSGRKFRRPLAELLGLFASVAEGLHAMHQAGFVHADLKPDNILVADDNTVKLIDFGQSSRIRKAKRRVQGTIDYIAPEQVQRGILDERTDVFGLGAALHRMVMGKALATQMNQTVSVHAQGLAGKRVVPVGRAPSVRLSPCVGRLIDDCCQTSPDDRLPDMPTVIERLRLAQTIVTKQAVPSASVVDKIRIAQPRLCDTSPIRERWFGFWPDRKEETTASDPWALAG